MKRSVTGLLATVAMLWALPVVPACGGGGDGGHTTVEAALAFSPSAMAFPGVCRGQADRQVVTVTNVSADVTVHMTGAELQGLGPEFGVEFAPATLLPGGTATVAVVFTPAAPATPPAGRAGFLAIFHDAPDMGGKTLFPILGDEGPVATLEADPDPIDFGTVDPASFGTLDVVVRNRGCDAPVLSAVYLDLAEDGLAFTLDALSLPGDAALPLALDPGAELGLALRFTPPACGPFATTLVVEGTTAGDVPQAWSFDVMGQTGPCPHLVATPGQVDFAETTPGLAVGVTLVLSNPGTRDLAIPAGGIAWVEGSDPGLTVLDAPDGEWTLVPGGSLELTVQWAPGVGAPTATTSLGTLRVLSDDPYHPSLLVPFNGGIAAPSLAVIPDNVDLGFTAPNTPVQRQVTLQNQGHGTLHVSSVEVVNPSRTDYGTEWEVRHGADAGPSLPAFEIAGNASDALTVVFTLRGPAGDVTATLRVTSDDPVRPVLDVPLLAYGIEDSWCQPKLVPASVFFGAVPIGESFDQEVSLVNVGTGYCTFVAASVADCATGADGATTCPEPFPPPSPGDFTLVSVPPTTMNGLAPGAKALLTVRFTPTVAGTDPAVPLEVHGRLALKIRDEVLSRDIELPAPGNPAVLAPNLSGKASAP
jgi:hypothetical protein